MRSRDFYATSPVRWTSPSPTVKMATPSTPSPTRHGVDENIADDLEPTGDKAKSGKAAPKEAMPLIFEAMDEIDPDGDWYSLAQLGQYITANHPDFDTRSYGRKKLIDLVDDLPRLEVKREESRIRVRRRD